MNKIILSFILITVAIFTATILNAQIMEKNSITHKVVIQLSNSDTLVHKSVIKQLNNILKAFDEIKIELVTHGPGIDFLLNNSAMKNNIELLSQKGIVFLVCKNTLNEKGITPAVLLPLAKVIPSGIAHLIIRQEDGWSYIKAGN